METEEGGYYSVPDYRDEDYPTRPHSEIFPEEYCKQISAGYSEKSAKPAKSCQDLKA